MDYIKHILSLIPWAFNLPLFVLYASAFFGVWSHWRKSITAGDVTDGFLAYLFTVNQQSSQVTIALLFGAISLAYSAGAIDGWPLLAVFNAGWGLGYAFDSKYNSGTPPKPPAPTIPTSVAASVKVSDT